jgi:hypothetical protein
MLESGGNLQRDLLYIRRNNAGFDFGDGEALMEAKD